MIKDNVHLLKKVDFKDLGIQTISESQGHPYNKQVLNLTNFKASNSNNDFLTNNSICSVTDTGILQAFNNKAELVFEVSFDWSLKQLIGSKSGKGSVKMSAQKVNFTQSYHNFNATTLVYVDWKDPEVKFDKSPDEKIEFWCKRLIETKLGEQINLEINKRLKKVNEEIIKSYKEYKITENKREITSVNSVFNPRGVKKGEDYFIVLNFKTQFKAYALYHRTTYPLNIPFSNAKNSDYMICYNTGFLAGYIGIRGVMKNDDEDFFKPLKAENYPSRTRFYRSIFPGIENRKNYSDDNIVKINFEIDMFGSIGNVFEKSFEVPINSSFYISGEENFLTFRTQYKVGFNFTVDKERVRAEFTKADITLFRIRPLVDPQGQFFAMELANSLSEQIIGYVIANDTGLTVDDIRKSEYKYDGHSDKDDHNGEICIFYKEETKTAY